MGRHGAVGEEPGPVERHDGPAPVPVEFDGQDG